MVAVLWLSRGREDGFIVPLICRHPFGLTFALGASLAVSGWIAESPLPVAGKERLVQLDGMLPLPTTTHSLAAMLQVLRQPGAVHVYKGSRKAQLGL